ncbi:hypothetical protein H4R34_003595 [Dimargaris verticillata]|uniref:Histidine phosphatase superfamily n=1 Tax=Dimargaris verticillata TaxID=2761393 RepID=A0A9W8B1U7_9FUNG|nr:hypothetical protein H4R34_003595 [Dimargaris verticillata]
MTSPLSHKVPEPYVTLYLCRHGETELNLQGVLQGGGINAPLNHTGQLQVARLGERFRNRPIDWVISSALLRAEQTAQSVAQYHPDAEFTIIPELNELCWGIWEGKKCPYMPSLLERWNSGDYEASFEQGESVLDAEKRITAAITQILEQAAGRKHVFVATAHGRLLRVILSSLIDNNLSHMAEYTHRNSCVNVVRVYRRVDLSPGQYQRFAQTRAFPKTWIPESKNALGDADAPFQTHRLRRTRPTSVLDDFVFIPVQLDNMEHLIES